jgi:hypothetical protein
VIHRTVRVLTWTMPLLIAPFIDSLFRGPIHQFRAFLAASIWLDWLYSPMLRLP